MGSTSGRSWSWRARDTLLQAQRRSPPSLVRFALAIVHQMNRLEPFDRAMTLAAQAFTSIFPVVIVTFSLLPQDDSGRLGGRVAQALALPESTRSALADAFPEDPEQATTFGLLGLLIVLVSATSFSRALTRMYAKAWSVRGPGWRRPWRWITAIVAITGCTLTLQVARRAASGSAAWTASALLLTCAVNTVLWTWVPSVLLAAEVPWRYLAPGGALMGAATVALYFASRIYMPSALSYADSTSVSWASPSPASAGSSLWPSCSSSPPCVGVVVAREPGPAARFLARRSSFPTDRAAPDDDSLIPHE